MNFKKIFLNHCNKESLEMNNNQIEIAKLINKFYKTNFNYNIFLNFFFKKKNFFLKKKIFFFSKKKNFF